MKQGDIKQRGNGTLYACTKCRTTRQFGFDLPDNVKAQPPLNCVKCGKVTPHQFVRVVPMVALKMPYDQVKWVMESEVARG